MKNHNPTGENQGEGDRIGARHGSRGVRELAAEGKVDEAARKARDHVEQAERRAKRGPSGGTRVSVDELVAKSRTVVDRVRPLVRRATSGLRSRFGRKEPRNRSQP